MFKFFEGLVDPYISYPQTDTPPRKLWPFLAEYIRPFRKVFAATAVLSAIIFFTIRAALARLASALVTFSNSKSPIR